MLHLHIIIKIQQVNLGNTPSKMAVFFYIVMQQQVNFP